MKRLILYIVIAATVLISLLWVTFAWYEPNIKSLLPCKPTIKEWQYKGHDMLLYEYKNSYSICHSPICKKCCQIYD